MNLKKQDYGASGIFGEIKSEYRKPAFVFSGG